MEKQELEKLNPEILVFDTPYKELKMMSICPYCKSSNTTGQDGFSTDGFEGYKGINCKQCDRIYAIKIQNIYTILRLSDHEVTDLVGSNVENGE